MIALPPPLRRRFSEVLERAQAVGALGPGPVAAHIDHSLALASLVGSAPVSVLDLGSGAGVPGLVLAAVWPSAEAVLLEAMAKRARWLEAAVVELGLARCSVHHARAEDAGRAPALREHFGLVVARSFGPPPATAECAAPLVAVGGELLVSEPPGADPVRWPTPELASLGLGPPVAHHAGRATAVTMRKLEPIAQRWPRRRGLPAKRPLW